jgi:hypothetical protein
MARLSHHPHARGASTASPVAHASLWHALRQRMSGPGGYYNLGNALGLATGLALQVASVQEGSLGATASAAFDYLAGSPSAVALTVAMLIFFWSGEVYHRAWANGFPPDTRLNRKGDLLSAFGALALGVGLLILQQPILAATAGLLHAIGKLGSALHRPDYAAASAGRRRPDPWRAVVLFSRIPAMAAALIELVRVVPQLGTDLPVSAAVAPAVLLGCYLAWAKADLMLFGR